MLKATEFEFRYRIWIIAAIYFVGFSLYNVDRINIVQYVINHTLGGNAPALWFHAAFGLGALLALFAAMIRTWAAAYLRSDVVQDSNLRADAVVADGPYRHVRNPLYFGSTLLAFGFAFLASPLGAFVIIGGLTFFHMRLIGLEESKLEQEHMESYRAFCQRVPRLLPSLSARVPASGLKPRWGQAVVGEIFMWGFFAGIAAFAFTFKINITWIIVGAALAFHVVLSHLIYRKHKPARSS